ncbi:MAG TPA: carboxypeptidase-like regulatory domain-containing protein [Planctomicrobium sp.]|nr:carboxypeptidase-like regulatory domain-containing protein [Planctomicrobium sp.]
MAVCSLSRIHLICSLVTVLSGLTIIGCGARSSPFPTGTVKGKVFDPSGKPLTEGEVSFFAATMGVGATMPIANDGTFVVPENIRTGMYVVTVAPAPLPPGDADGSPVQPSNRKQIEALIPKIYRNERTTPLKDFEIKQGNNEVEIKLQNL